MATTDNERPSRYALEARTLGGKATLHATISGFAAGAGPLGAAAGAVIATLADAGLEFVERHLTARQEARANVALNAAASLAHELADEGAVLRSEFAEAPTSGDSVYFEIAEAAFRAATESVEQRKAVHLGYLTASFAFATATGPNDAHAMLQLASRLTYRQFCLLQAFVECADPPWDDNNLSAYALSEPLIGAEIDGLRSERLLTPPSTWLSDVRPTALGRTFAEMACLARLADDELREASRRIVVNGFEDPTRR